MASNGINGLQQGTNSHSGQNDELGNFLQQNKEDFMKALNGGDSLDGWVIVMGESCFTKSIGAVC